MAVERYKSDYLIIGSGIAGLSAALHAADHGSVILVTKQKVADCNSYWAQGGIACVLDDDDSFDAHYEDTLEAGAGLCKQDVVRHIVENGPARVRELIDLGFHYTRRWEVGDVAQGEDPDAADLGREGGHSKRRVMHSGDITGREIIRVLHDACRKRDNITICEDHQAVDLICSRRLGWDGPNRALGAWVLDRNTYATHTFLSRHVILASGGAGKVYLYSSNPDVACGEGVAMAYRAYTEIANMEFFQFHPTILHHPRAKSFLISEAVRGEGGVLKTRRHGELVEFMHEYDKNGSLATRDIVARAIDRELKKSGRPCVFLDITRHSEENLKKRFPNIFATCAEVGLNMATDPIPVVPAAHYCCGGVRTDVHGRTCVENLYAIGEVGCTGLHGANRLASNSLLEALVLAHNAVQASIREDNVDTRHWDDDSARRIRDWSAGDAQDPDEMIVIYHNWDEIRRFMWDYVGIFRTSKRLERAKSRVRNIRKEIEHFYWDFTLTPELCELRNMASVAEMIIDSALARKESVGLHYNLDCPPPLPGMAVPETILRRPGFEKVLH